MRCAAMLTTVLKNAGYSDISMAADIEGRIRILLPNVRSYQLVRSISDDVIARAGYTIGEVGQIDNVFHIDVLAEPGYDLPAGFTSIEQGVPDHDRPVVAIRRSGYLGAKFEIITARYMLAYRPNSPWRKLCMDSVHDDGEPVLGWREAPELAA